MNITVRLYAGLQPQGIAAGEKLLVELPEGATMRDLAEKLELPRDLVLLFVVNSIVSEIHAVLQEADTVDVFPPLVGG